MLRARTGLDGRSFGWGGGLWAAGCGLRDERGGREEYRGKIMDLGVWFRPCWGVEMG